MYNLIVRIVLNTFIKNHLQSMTPWSLESMDIIKMMCFLSWDGLPDLVAVAFSCCVFLFLHLVLYLRTEELLHWDQVLSKNIQFLRHEKLFTCFWIILWLIIHLHCDMLSTSWFHLTKWYFSRTVQALLDV